MFYYIFTSKSPKSEHRSWMENHRLNLWTESALNAIIVQMSRQKMLMHLHQIPFIYILNLNVEIASPINTLLVYYQWA